MYRQMWLPVSSLSSLSSRVVLAQDLDTRELPRHLHRQMEQYRRLRGEWTLLSVDLQVSALCTKAIYYEVLGLILLFFPFHVLKILGNLDKAVGASLMVKYFNKKNLDLSLLICAFFTYLV